MSLDTPDRAVEALTQRGKTYGKFVDNASLAQGLKRLINAHTVSGNLADDQREALEVIMQKVSRICIGDADYVDNWLDIEGYARLVRERLEQKHTLRADNISLHHNGDLHE